MSRGTVGGPRRVVRRVSLAEDGRSLLDLLASWVPEATGLEVARARLRALVLAGAARVDGAALRAPGRPLRAGAKVDLRLRLEALRSPSERTDVAFTLGEDGVLFRDRWLLAVAKPPGLPTHATADPGRPSLVSAVERRLGSVGEASAAAGQAGGAGRRPYLAVHQRLDRDTSGVVLFATSPAANAGLADAFARGGVSKVYLALVAAGEPATPERFTVSAPLSVAPSSGRVSVGGPGALAAVTEVEVRERLGPALLVEARPRTGRKHQVRAHLAHSGHPVLGDPLYGAPGGGAGQGAVPRLMLHALRLELPHPVTGDPLVIESPIPPDFEGALERARSAARRR